MKNKKDGHNEMASKNNRQEGRTWNVPKGFKLWGGMGPDGIAENNIALPVKTMDRASQNAAEVAWQFIE